MPKRRMEISDPDVVAKAFLSSVCYLEGPTAYHMDVDMMQKYVQPIVTSAGGILGRQKVSEVNANTIAKARNLYSKKAKRQQRGGHIDGVVYNFAEIGKILDFLGHRDIDRTRLYENDIANVVLDVTQSPENNVHLAQDYDANTMFEQVEDFALEDKYGLMKGVWDALKRPTGYEDVGHQIIGVSKVYQDSPKRAGANKFRVTQNLMDAVRALG